MKGTIDLTRLRTVEVKENERIENARKRRNTLLSQFDGELYRNPLYWGELTPEQRKARTEYRKQLMDVTKQSGFPDSIIWPVKPE